MTSSETLTEKFKNFDLNSLYFVVLAAYIIYGIIAFIVGSYLYTSKPYAKYLVYSSIPAIVILLLLFCSDGRNCIQFLRVFFR